MRIFLDVGAHEGQSLAAAVDPEFAFDQIVCFEPVISLHPKILKLADKRTKVLPFGLWNRNAEMPVFQPGTMGAGIWKKDQGKTDQTQACQFVRASDWFAQNVQSGDVVYLKLNCEGAECDVIDDLLDFGEFEKVAFVMIDFDVRKIAAMKHRQAEIQARLETYPFPRVATSKQVMKGATHSDRIKNWLRLAR